MNGRPIKDGALRAAVRQAYREFLAPTLQPVYALFVTIDPAEVDVNVHPAKTEVRFRNGAQVFRAVQQVVLDGLRAANLAPRPGAPPAAPASRWSYAEPSEPASLVREPAPPALSPLPPGLTRAERAAPWPAAPDLFTTTNAPAVPAVPERTGGAWLRLFHTYVLYESGPDLVLVDQHALHERVLYERLRVAIQTGPLPSQRLLVPVVVEVSRAEALRVDDVAPDLKVLGVDVSPLGETTLAVHAVPALLKDVEVEAVVRAALAEDAASAREPLDHRLHTMACHGAVRAGDALDDEEINALLEEAEGIPEAKACPHGRPTSVRLAKGDLERWFKRTGF
jgi:DNA mismatch repair protein MutL